MAQTIAEIKKIFSNENLNSTFLLVGPDRADKVRLALELAQSLVCESPEIANSLREPCRKCGSCLRMAQRQSEALLILKLEKTQIRIEQAREILDFLSLQSITPYRIIVVEEAESLNPAAANALLKILEEPPPRTIFFLIAPTPKHVLPTLRSRSMILTLPSSNPDPIQNMDMESRERINEIIQWWTKDPQSYLRNAFKERVKDRSLAQVLALGLQGHFRKAFYLECGLDTGVADPWMKRALELFDLAVSLERELQGSRDSLMVFEEFWIRSHGIAAEVGQ